MITTAHSTPASTTPALTTPSILASFTLAVGGAAFLLYPALRPYADETTLDGLAAMASNRWVAAHLLAMLGFILFGVGIRALATQHPGATQRSAPTRLSVPTQGWSVPTQRSARAAGALAWLGGSLVLPYYGAEAFGLHVIGARAVADQDVSLVSLVDAFRYGVIPMTLFGAGLLLLAGAGIALLISLRHSTLPARIAGILIAIGMVGYLPQFFGSPGVRIGHGLLLAVGCLLLAVAVRRRTASLRSRG